MYERPCFAKKFMEKTQILHVLEHYDLARVQTKRKTTTTKKETKPNQTKSKTKQNETNKQTNMKTKPATKQNQNQARQRNVWFLTDLLQEEYNRSFLAITFFSQMLHSFTSQVPAIYC